MHGTGLRRACAQGRCSGRLGRISPRARSRGSALASPRTGTRVRRVGRAWRGARVPLQLSPPGATRRRGRGAGSASEPPALRLNRDTGLRSRTSRVLIVGPCWAPGVNVGDCGWGRTGPDERKPRDEPGKAGSGAQGDRGAHRARQDPGWAEALEQVAVLDIETALERPAIGRGRRQLLDSGGAWRPAGELEDRLSDQRRVVGHRDVTESR